MPKFIGEVGVKRLWNKISEQFVQKEVGKGLSENNFSDEYKTELDNLISGTTENEVIERIKYYGDPDIIPSPASYFTVNSTGETITGLTATGKTQTELVIPYKIDGKEITKLENDRIIPILSGNRVITKVVIPNSVTSIGDCVFAGCRSLTSITIPNSVTTITSDAFSGCSSLASITIPNSVTTIDSGAFSGCMSLTSITIPNSVTTIDSNVFDSCISLTSVTIPNSVTSIGYRAFGGCSSLTSITIPNSVTIIDEEVFEDCTSLKSINIPNSVTWIDNFEFDGCTNLTIYCEQGSYADKYAKDNNIPIVYTEVKPDSDNAVKSYTSVIERIKYYGDPDIIPSDESYFTVNETGETITGLTDAGKTQTELVIPYKINGKKITTLYNTGCIDGPPVSILDGNSVITKVVIPNSVTSIRYSAFAGCRSLTSITIPNSVTSIEGCAFFDCSGLTSITIPNSVTSIDNAAFYNCSGLTSITIPNSVTSIDNAAFYDCSGLTSITISNSVTTIYESTFCGCSSLTSLTIPNSVTSIDQGVFGYTGPSENLTIYCSQHSYADTFAQWFGIPVKYTEVIDGLGGFWGLDLPLIKTITLEESVTSIDILSRADSRKLQEFTVLLFIKALGDAIESNLQNCIMCLRTEGDGNYFGYTGGYVFAKDKNSYAAWHTKIYDNKFALTDLYKGIGTHNSDKPYMGSQGLADATTAQYSSYTSYSGDEVDNLNVFISSNDVSRGAIIPQGSMVFLLGR